MLLGFLFGAVALQGLVSLRISTGGILAGGCGFGNCVLLGFGGFSLL